MILGELALAVWLVVGAIPNTDHVIIGVAPSSVLEVRLNGVELSASPVSSSPLGILIFSTPEVPGDGPATVSVRKVGTPSPALVCGESPR